MNETDIVFQKLLNRISVLEKRIKRNEIYFWVLFSSIIISGLIVMPLANWWVNR